MSESSTFEFETLALDEYGQLLEKQYRLAPCRQESLGKDTQLDLVAIPGGFFLMGASRSEEGWHPSQSPQHSVTIAPFWIGVYPITQAQWRSVAAFPAIQQSLNPDPSCFKGDKRPVEQVSWDDAVEFCARLSAHTGKAYRLPSEAEWEYACRANTTTPFHFGETITTDLANYSGVNWEYEGKICSKGFYGKGANGDDRRETTEVGYFQIANGFGLYDMHGLVKEWCLDCWHENYEGAPLNGTAWIDDGDCRQRILRGGSWNGSPKACRSAFRSKLSPASTLYDVGFRVVGVLTEEFFKL